MRELHFISPEYQKQLKKLVFENMENCERLAKCMEALNWKWVDASANNGIPNAMEIHNAILSLFVHCEHDILEKSAEELMKFNGFYTAKTGGLVLIWFWNPVTFELYDFEILFDFTA